MGLTWGDPRRPDHIDRNGLNNQRANLRIVTHAENQQNLAQVTGRGTSPYRGVSWDHTARLWQGQARLRGKNRFIGRYETQELARDAVVAWRRANMPFSEADK
jgi:hypothetical protein